MKNLTVVVTVRNNRSIMAPDKQRAVSSFQFVFSNNITVVSYVPKENKIMPNQVKINDTYQI